MRHISTALVTLLLLQPFAFASEPLNPGISLAPATAPIARSDSLPIVVYTKAIDNQTKLEVDSHEVPVDWKIMNSRPNAERPKAWFLYRYLLVTPRKSVVLWTGIQQTFPGQDGKIQDCRSKIFDMALSDGYLTVVQQYQGFPVTMIDTMPVSTTTSMDEKNPPKTINCFKGNSTTDGVSITAGVIAGTRKAGNLTVTLINGSETFVYKLVADKWVLQPPPAPRDGPDPLAGQ